MKNSIVRMTVLVTASICNAAMDTVQNCFSTSVFASLNENFFNPAKSWINKWQVTTDGELKEKFLFSSNMLVALTDFWHLAKTIMLICLVVSIVLYEPIASKISTKKNEFWYKLLDVLIYYSIFTIVFEIAYRVFRGQAIL